MSLDVTHQPSFNKFAPKQTIPGPRLYRLFLSMALVGLIFWIFFGAFLVRAASPDDNPPPAAASISTPLPTDRGRVQIVSGTVIADNGYPLRGEAIFLTDSDGSTTGNFTLDTLYDPVHWQTLRDDFHLNTVRFFISRPPQNWGGGPGDDCFPPVYRCYQLDYIIYPGADTAKPYYGKTALQIIDDVVDMASQMGMYIIIDYHPVGGHADADATAWWSEIAPRYKDRSHVLYELANEPVAWSPGSYDAAAVTFQENLFQLIRTNAPETHIILWSFAHGAAGMLDKVNEGTTISYANASVGFHPYGAYSESEITALKAHYPVINTEIGKDRINKTQSAEDLGISWIWLNGSDIPGLRDAVDAFNPGDVYWPADPGNAAQDDFTLEAMPTVRSIDAGGVATYTIRVQPTGNFSAPVTLTTHSPALSLTLSLTPTSVISPGQATLTVTDSQPLSPTTGVWYSLPLTGTANGLSHTISVGLLVGGERVYLPLLLK